MSAAQGDDNIDRKTVLKYTERPPRLPAAGPYLKDMLAEHILKHRSAFTPDAGCIPSSR
jgi:hypothetical protein